VTGGVGPPVFRHVPSPGTAELQVLVQRIAERIGRLLEKRGLIERDAENAWLSGDPERAGLLDDLIGYCITYRIAVGMARELGWSDEVNQCQSIPGVGPLTVLAMVASYHRGELRRADAFIAFLGMDVRVRESGPYRGRRKLTRKGDPELRRLLFNAAMQGRRNALWEPCYLRLRERGLSSTAAFVALGRKLARLCFALLRNGKDFNPDIHRGACRVT
jgi:transposase